MAEHGGAFGHLGLGPTTFYVADINRKLAELADGYEFEVAGGPCLDGEGACRLAVVRKAGIELRLVEARAADHPARAYVERHGDGVADIALTTDDVAGAFDEAVRRGATPVGGPVGRNGEVIASIVGFGDVTHTFVPRRRAPSSTAAGGRATGRPTAELGAIDHFAICLEAGQLDPTIDFYERVLDFRTIFAERIVVGRQAMISKVVQSASGMLTFTLIEPDTSREPGQIDDFLKNHDGSGVQHVAFTTDDIIAAVRTLQENGVEFLTAPDMYYQLLGDHITLRRHSIRELRATNVLADEDEHGQLFQIFTRSEHPRDTFFFEVIERFGATTFGSGNVTALYEAVEAQRSR